MLVKRQTISQSTPIDPIPINNTTTTPTPDTDDDDNSSGLVIPIWLLWTIVVVYWLFLFLFCCCRISQRDHRYTHQAETECMLFSVECCECIAQCTEDLGKGQMANDDAPGGIDDLSS